MSRKDSFFERVHGVVRGIPRGRVMTYGQIADILGTRDARRVGHALHANRSHDVPCHRVVNKDGRLAPGYAFGGMGEQRARLVAEGVGFVDSDHIDAKFIVS